MAPNASMELATQLLNLLREAQPPPGYSNPYVAAPARHNLRLFLNSERPQGPRLLFVGEAPGYRGAAISGVPFASLSTLAHPWGDPWSAFGPLAGFMLPETAYWREATATLFWNGLAAVLPDFPLPFTWNAVPFHPSKAGIERNATPASGDIRVALPWLQVAIELVSPDCVIAVGRNAAFALDTLDVSYRSVRHPSHGGRDAFITGLQEVRHYLAGRPSSSR